MWGGDGHDEPGPGGPMGRGPPVDPKATVGPRVIVMLLLIGLFAEFVIGVVLAAWGTTLPSSVSALFGPNAGSYGWLSVHAVLAVLLVILGLALIVLVARLHRPFLLFGAIAGFVFIALAALSGYGFVEFPGNPAYIVFMGIFFLLGWTAYTRLAMQLRRSARWAMRRERMQAGPPPPA